MTVVIDDGRDAIPLHVVSKPALTAWRNAQTRSTRAWLDSAGFRANAGQTVHLPGSDGLPDRLIAGLGAGAGVDSLGTLALKLPEGDYRLAAVNADATDSYRLALGWALGGYQFDAYRTPPRAAARLLIPTRDRAVLDEIDAIALCRDLINTPASDMLPHHLEAAARRLAANYGATIEVTAGDALIHHGYNAIHAVGRAGASAPRLIDLRWSAEGAEDDPAITLVGKGVCFDSGGLNLKSASNMRLMKKDMGGAAHVLGLAALIMARRAPIGLRVLIPAVENAVSGNAYRPGDIIRTYRGVTVEIHNTDAEGRLVLADALALAAEEAPDLIIDFATLTGAARSALGTELPAMFANDNDLAEAIAAAAADTEDPVWRLPLFPPYRRLLNSKVADLVNAPSSPYAGAIAAALFLERFVGDTPWAHFDIMGWNLSHRPAHPEGGEAMGLRAVYGYLAARFGV